MSYSFESSVSEFEFYAEKSFIVQEINKNLPARDTITYTKVPRGVILSVSQEELFDNNSDEISPKGKLLLLKIANVLKTFDNDCTIEAHSEELLKDGKVYSYDWEISIVRATGIAESLSDDFGIESSRLFPIGFGKIMPFRGNVAPSDFTDNRIDFVIFDYTVQK